MRKTETDKGKIMSYKPILFSAPMVQAILDGRKTQTRRVVKPQPTEPIINSSQFDFADDEIVNILRTPKYKVGDILWVRETTYLFGKWVKNGQTKTGKQKYKFVWNKSKPVYYAASSSPDSVCTKKDQIGYFKRPSIFMPREAARIFLKVTDVRVERVQDISEKNAKAEGIKSYWAEPHRDTSPFIGAAKEIGEDLCSTRREAFQQLWDSLNAKRGYGWDTNPWVWVYTFERTDKPTNT